MYLSDHKTCYADHLYSMVSNGTSTRSRLHTNSSHMSTNARPLFLCHIGKGIIYFSVHSSNSSYPPDLSDPIHSANSPLRSQFGPPPAPTSSSVHSTPHSLDSPTVCPSVRHATGSSYFRQAESAHIDLAFAQHAGPSDSEETSSWWPLPGLRPLCKHWLIAMTLLCITIQRLCQIRDPISVELDL
jgi:hypothetical protein